MTKSETWMRDWLGREIDNAITLGKAHQRMETETKLNDTYTWVAIQTLCAVLEENTCLIWNKIVTECPNFGEITGC